MNGIRRVLRPLCRGVVLVLKPVKVAAFRARSDVVRRVVLSVTTPIDFALVWLCVQNEAMLLHARAYGGNFLFGGSVMVTDHATTVVEVARPSLRGNNFMGVFIVSSDSNVFSTNSGLLNVGPPMRDLGREWLDRHVFDERVRAHTVESVRATCLDLLDEWRADPGMATTYGIRTAATRVFLRLLAGATLPQAEAGSVTRAYIRRFVEASLFRRYAPFVCEWLGTTEHLRRDAFLPLRRRGIDPMVIDATLFAAMFSIGTLVIRCVEDARSFGIDYAGLERSVKRRFVTESVRLFPTVTSVHRVVEEEETVIVDGREVVVRPGGEIAYPFVCSNRDPARFPEPERFRLDRAQDEYDAVLSWSAGPHACPARELSILVTMTMLDTLSDRFSLADLDIANPAF